jgi:hypothetical protein
MGRWHLHDRSCRRHQKHSSLVLGSRDDRGILVRAGRGAVGAGGPRCCVLFHRAWLSPSDAACSAELDVAGQGRAAFFTHGTLLHAVVKAGDGATAAHGDLALHLQCNRLLVTWRSSLFPFGGPSRNTLVLVKHSWCGLSNVPASEGMHVVDPTLLLGLSTTPSHPRASRCPPTTGDGDLSRSHARSHHRLLRSSRSFRSLGHEAS